MFRVYGWGLACSLAACASAPEAGREAGGHEHEHGAHELTPMVRGDEPHLANIRQLTFGGENAEAYFSVDGTELSFQSTRDDLECDQIFRMNADGSNLRMVSTGRGRTTCAYIQTDGSLIYASTHGHGAGCLWKADHSMGYVWPLYPEMDIWAADADGSNPRVLFASDGYDAEATVCAKDGRVLFTSTKDGDLDLYMMERDGTNVRQLTNTPGYDGGAFFSSDCSKIVWRASRPEGDALVEYRALLEKNLVRPSKLEIFVADADGQNVVQVTKSGAASFAPYLHPDNQRLVYVSNKHDPNGRNFDIFLIHVDGTNESQITHNPSFDGFPMWTHDGEKLVFASNRTNQRPGETNVFIADWTE
jgi:Tol biopolymer transport system component